MSGRQPTGIRLYRTIQCREIESDQYVGSTQRTCHDISNPR
ncbi:hypothetical protein EVA_08434 [gut metagenome]|uniref:Uncharacterized protein n=1 Tax=gut metagenome TaxID=749906 RepID=J9G9B4_9ZZZZ